MTRFVRILLTIGLLVPAVPAASVEAAPPGRVCFRESVTDIAGDGDIDIARISVDSDCRRLTFTLTTHAPFTDSDLESWVIALGPVDHRSISCDGMTQLVGVFGRPGGGLGSGIREVSSCTNVFGSRQATARRLSPTSVSVSFTPEAGDLPLTESFRWQSSTFSTRGSDPDTAPRFASIAAVRFTPLLVKATHTADRQALAVSWDPVHEHHGLIDRFDVQYQARGGTWSKVIRVGGHERSTELTRLTPGAIYTIRVAAVTRGTRSPWKNVSLRYVAPPSAPQNLRVVPFRSGHVVEFEPPATDGGRKIEWYTYLIRSGGRTSSALLPARSRRIGIDDLEFPATIWIKVATNEIDATLVPWARIDLTEPPAPPE